MLFYCLTLKKRNIIRRIKCFFRHKTFGMIYFINQFIISRLIKTGQIIDRIFIFKIRICNSLHCQNFSSRNGFDSLICTLREKIGYNNGSIKLIIFFFHLWSLLFYFFKPNIGCRCIKWWCINSVYGFIKLLIKLKECTSGCIIKSINA